MPETHNPQPFRNAGDIPMRPKRWFVRHIIPQGYVTLLVGDVTHGLHEVMYDFAARASRGADFPGTDIEFETGPLLVVSLIHASEEHAIPILTASEAVLEKIDVASAADILSFDKSVESLIENWLIQKGTSAQAVFIDDFHVSARYTSKSEFITSVSALAVRYGVAVICGVNQQDVGASSVRSIESMVHPHKAAIYGLVGDEDGVVLASLSPALTPDAKDIGFSKASKTVGFAHRVPHIHWNKTAKVKNTSLQNLGAVGDARKELVPFLKGLNVVTSKDLYEEARRLSITEKNARMAVRLEGFSKARRGGRNGYSYWYRPGFKDAPIHSIPDDYLKVG